MDNIMLDLETAGSGFNAAIAAVGAVAFDPACNCNVVSGYVFHGTILQFWGALFSGFAVAVLLIFTVVGLVWWYMKKHN